MELQFGTFRAFLEIDGLKYETASASARKIMVQVLCQYLIPVGSYSRFLPRQLSSLVHFLIECVFY